MNNAILFFTSGIISICSYCLLLLLLIWTFLSPLPTRYSSLEDSQLALESISIEAIIESTPSKGIDNSLKSASTPLAGSGIKDMFERIDNAKASQSLVGDNREQVEKNETQNEQIQQILNAAQSLQQSTQSLSNITISSESSSSDGEYDEWYAEVERIVKQQWQQAFYAESKLQSTIHIKISKNGSFSYKVVKYSGNQAFDDSLKEALLRCQQLHFPPHKSGEREIAMIFKNKK